MARRMVHHQAMVWSVCTISTLTAWAVVQLRLCDELMQSPLSPTAQPPLLP